MYTTVIEVEGIADIVREGWALGGPQSERKGNAPYACVC
jgi:hypothetical protein